MLLIEYISKEIKPIKIAKIKATLISYEITEKDMNLIANLQTDEYKIQRFFMYKDWGTFELIVDNIENGKVIQGGKVGNKFLLNLYDVEEGLNELLIYLSEYTV
jgi:hypothetical protein